MEGSGPPIFGAELSDSPIPKFDLLAIATGLDTSAEQLMRERMRDHWRKAAHLVREAECVLSLASGTRGSLARVTGVTPNGGTIRADRNGFVLRCRQSIARKYFDLIVKSFARSGSATY